MSLMNTLSVITTVFLLTACGEYTYKHYDFIYDSQSFSWGEINIWASSTAKNLNEKTVVYSAPYQIHFQIITYEGVSECVASVKTARLIRKDTQQIIELPLVSKQEFQPYNIRSRASRFIDGRQWREVLFTFEDLNLEYVDYELNIVFSATGQCANVRDSQIKVAFDRRYYETSNAIWFQ